MPRAYRERSVLFGPPDSPRTGRITVSNPTFAQRAADATKRIAEDNSENGKTPVLHGELGTLYAVFESLGSRRQNRKAVEAAREKLAESYAKSHEGASKREAEQAAQILTAAIYGGRINAAQRDKLFGPKEDFDAAVLAAGWTIVHENVDPRVRLVLADRPKEVLAFDNEYAKSVAEQKGNGMKPLMDTRLLMQAKARTLYLADHDEATATDENIRNFLLTNYGAAAVSLYDRGMAMDVYWLDRDAILSDHGALPSIILPDLWHKRRIIPQGVLQISGGAAGLEGLDSFETGEEAVKALENPNPSVLTAYTLAQAFYDVARDENLALVTGGTQSGIMQAVGLVHANEVANQALLSESERENQPQLPVVVQVVPGNVVVAPGNGKVKPGAYAVAPGTVGVVVEGADFGGEGVGIENGSNRLAYVPAQEGVTSEIQQKTQGHTRLVAAMNGGKLTLDEVANALHGLSKRDDTDATFLFVKGTGRSADWISALLENTNLSVADLVAEHPGDKDLSNPNYVQTLQQTIESLRQLKATHPGRIEIVDAKSENALLEVKSAMKRLIAIGREREHALVN